MNSLDVQHKLRTPLGIMQGYGEMLAEDILNEEQVKIAGRAIYKAARELNRAIDEVLTELKLEERHDYHRTGETTE